MHLLTTAKSWSLLWILLAFVSAAPARAVEPKLQGTWVATTAQSDGKVADDVVGHRLTFSGDGFEIQSKDGKPLYAGTVQIDPSSEPVAIDFIHDDGTLAGKVWKGVYVLDGDTLTVCDNAPNLNAARPTALEAEAGSGYVLITFKRTMP